MRLSSPFRILYTIFLALAGLLCCVMQAQSDVLTATLTLSEPEGGFFAPGDTLMAVLILRGANDVALRVDQYQQNNLQSVELWVSGARQDLREVGPYEHYFIQNTNIGFNRNSGFDPETGRMPIVLPDNLQALGTYVVQFKIMRRNCANAFVQADFQMGQIRPTVTRSNAYIYCTACHGNISHHGANNLLNCANCHTRSYQMPYSFMMNWPQTHRDESCRNCHRAAADINKISRQACYTCHEPCQHAPGDVDGVGCLNCHDHNNSDQWIYEAHNMSRPNQPSAFNLTSPAHNTWVNSDQTTLLWSRSSDPDAGDVLRYEVELSFTPEFQEPIVLNTGNAVRFTIHDLLPDSYYLWRVKAVDLNSDGRYSNQTFRFQTAQPQPPSMFELLSPPDEERIDFSEGLVLDLAWQEAIDPDPESEVLYNVFASASSDTVRRELSFFDITETTVGFPLVDSLQLGWWAATLEITWRVEAVSNEDATTCSSPFTCFISANPDTTNGIHVENWFAKEFRISEVYPNPFNSAARITVDLPLASTLHLGLYNLSGQQVASCFQGAISAGRHVFTVDGSELPTGIYFLRWQTNAGFSGSQRALVIR